MQGVYYMKTGFCKADILLPNKIDVSKWSVVACDQYTSEPKYWEETTEIVGDAPSTLKITLPEVYLENEDAKAITSRIESINKTMLEYLNSDIFKEHTGSFIYTERTGRDGKVRCGLMGAVDLEEYDYNKGSQSLIRATEGTVLDRLPPRVKVRENASLELPHIMLLVDDESNSVFGGISPTSSLEKVYDFTLMHNSGEIKGWVLDNNSEKNVTNSLEKLANPDSFNKKYNITDKGVLLFAVGDGNHSLATAKQCYEQNKLTMPQSKWENHPSRYALIELVNLHDSSLEFEAIHRVIFDIDRTDLLAEFEKFYDISHSQCDGQKIVLVLDGEQKPVWIKNPSANLPVGSLQNFIDSYLSSHNGKVDYIHGDDVVTSLSHEEQNIGFLLPSMEKNQLFKTVIVDGALPRKTFSMGHAWDKRFYLECRKVKK